MTKQEAQLASRLNGEVRISLETYHKLISEHVKYNESRLVYEDATQAVANFLNHLRSRDDINLNDLMKSFNENSVKLHMFIDESGSVRMGLKGDVE